MRVLLASLRQRGLSSARKLVSLPPSDLTTDPRLFRSFVVLHLVGPLFGLPVCAALLALDDGSGPVAAAFTAGVFLFWLLPYLAKRNLARAAFLSVQLLTFVSLFGAFFYGGLNSPFAVWLIVAVLLSFLYLNTSIGRCLVAMGLQAAVFVAAHEAWPQPDRLTEAELGTLFLASSLAAALYVSVIAAFYSRISKESSKLASIAARYEATARGSRAAIRKLEDDDRRDATFMATISHDLRTALDVVVGYSELLLEDASADECEVDTRRLTRITAASRQMLALVSDGDRLVQTVAERSSAAPTEPRGAEFEPAGAELCKHQGRVHHQSVPFGSASIGMLLIAASAIAAPLSPAATSSILSLLSLAGLALVAIGYRRTLAGSDGLDALTGLLGRAAFLDELGTRLAPSSGLEAALLFADLNGFKEVNDTLGHDVGDQLLARIATRFAAAATPGLVLARLGGDEFGAVAFGPGAESVVQQFAEAMVDALAEPIQTEEHHLTITVSIGLASGQAGQCSARELLRRGDVAMYRAKHDQGMPIQNFEIQMDEALNFRRTMRNDLGAALCSDQLDLHLQPVVDARSGEPASAEALLRWTHPVLGPVSPAKLIALAEESGQIIAIDDWVLERALELITRFGALPIAINISPVQFRHPNFARKIVDRLQAHAVPPQLLRLEITEGVLVTHTRAASRAIAQLREAGVKVALDDFGTGYSSLSYLRDFGFDFLKVDRSFVSAVGSSRQGTELLRAIIELGHSLSMSVIAEGVETAEQAGLVQLLGCDFIQGYFTGRPMASDQLEEWLSIPSSSAEAQGRTATSPLLRPSERMN